MSEDEIPHLDLPPLADSPATMSLPATAAQPALIESHAFFSKLRIEKMAAEEEIHKIEAQITALERRAADLHVILDGCEAALARQE